MSQTRELLVRWHDGDEAALSALVQQDLAWIEGRVRQRLGPLLRKRHDTQDIVQITLLEVLRYGPRFVLSDRGQFRALLARMVENALRNQADHEGAARRDARRERSPSSADSVLTLDVAAPHTQPDEAAARSELQAWIRLALELLDPDDRDVIVWRQYQELSFAAIGERMGIAENAARMRFARALPKLAAKLDAIRAGRLGAALQDAP